MNADITNDKTAQALLQIIARKFAKSGDIGQLEQALKELEEKVDNLDVAGVTIETDETLSFRNGVLGVNTADDAEADNTLPITSAAVHTQIGNIETILKTI